MNQSAITARVRMPSRNSFRRQRALAGLLAGALAGLFGSLAIDLPHEFGATLLLSMGLGVLFGLVCGPSCLDAGAGLVWGQAYGLLWWVIGALTLAPLAGGKDLLWTAVSAGDLFAELLAQWVGLGALLGLVYYWLSLWLVGTRPAAELDPDGQPTRHAPMGQAIVPPLVQSLIIGALSGLLGSWVFARGIDRAAFYPLVAQLVRSESMMVGTTLHYLIGAVIGITFGLLFQREARRPGLGLIWGMSYGLLWWVVGPLTLMPWLLGVWQRADWSLSAGQQAAPSLIAHLLYGALVGYITGVASKLWEVLFVASDPLHRTAEGAGVRGVRNIGMGVAGGVAGGLLFTIIMAGSGALPAVASLVGARSSLVGLLVHLVISIIVGVTYGLLFQAQTRSYGAGLAWGLLYGLFWWALGALTLFPLLLRRAPDWSLGVIAGAYPSLVGHLLYGAGLGLFFHYLAARYDAELGRRRPPGHRRRVFPAAGRSDEGTAAPALWAVTLVVGVLLTLLLSVGASSGSSGY
jgi:uncharacterized membrane protein YagU involved in acid resistance